MAKAKKKASELESMLTPSQRVALKYMTNNYNCLISGPAGTGKSFVTSYYKKHYNKQIPVLASTALAATIVNGRTVHSFFSLGTMSEDFYVIMERIYDNPKLISKLIALEEVMIDEVSMLSGKVFDMMDQILKTVKDNKLPFGGVRLICIGDFHQIPPIDEVDGRPDYCFLSHSWRSANFAAFDLKEPMRQSDSEFLGVLSNIRKGICTDADDKFIRNLTLTPEQEFTGTRLFGKKDKVNDFNMKKLSEIDSPIKEYPVVFRGEKKFVDKLRKNLPIEDVVILKVGALVMVRVNDNKLHEYVNGTLGTVVSLRRDSVLIKKITGELITINKHTFKLTGPDGEPLSECEGIPLTVAWGLTYYKAQGQTIDQCIVDFSQTWNGSMVYVALTRTTSADRLRVVNWNRRVVKCDPIVLRYYEWIDKQRVKLEKNII